MMNQIQRNVLTSPTQHKQKGKMNMPFLNPILVSSRPADQLLILLGRQRDLTRVELL